MYKIGYFIESFFPNIGGAETRALKILSNIKSFNVNVYTINFGYPEKEKLRNININRIINADVRSYFKNDGRNLLISYKFARNVGKILKNEDFDIYIFDQFPYIHFNFNVKHLKYKKKLVQFHEILKGYYGNGIKEKMLEILENNMFSNADYNIALSEYNANLLNKSYGIKMNKILVIPNGVDYVKKIEKKGKNIIYVGRNTKAKNLTAIFELAKILKDMQFVLVTDTNDHLDNVTVKKSLDAKALEEEYSNSCIYITTSIREGFSIASLEAMSHGLPVIYLKSPFNKSLESIVKDNYNGFGCNSINEMAEKIRYIYKNDSEWEKMSENAYKFASNFLWENIAKDYENKLLSMVKE